MIIRRLLVLQVCKISRSTDSADISDWNELCARCNYGNLWRFPYAGVISAWIDFNLDGDFDDSGEQLGVFLRYTNGNAEWTFTVP